jgi:inhibitor of cysteine peptidase
MEGMILVKLRPLLKSWVVVAILVSSTVLGCTMESRNPSPIKTLQVSIDDVLKQSSITQNVTLAVGNTLKVQLASNYTTPYRWAPQTKVGDSGIVKQIGHEFVQPSSDALGAPGTEVWTFTALKAGATTISTDYASFVGHDPKPICTYTANVTVQ